MADPLPILHAALHPAFDVPGVSDVPVFASRAPDDAASTGVPFAAAAAGCAACPAAFPAAIPAPTAHACCLGACDALRAAPSCSSLALGVDAPVGPAAAGYSQPPLAHLMENHVFLADVQHASAFAYISPAASVRSGTLSPSSNGSFEDAANDVPLVAPCFAAGGLCSSCDGSMCAVQSGCPCASDCFCFGGQPCVPPPCLGALSSCASRCASGATLHSPLCLEGGALGGPRQGPSCAPVLPCFVGSATPSIAVAVPTSSRSCAMPFAPSLLVSPCACGASPCPGPCGAPASLGAPRPGLGDGGLMPSPHMCVPTLGGRPTSAPLSRTVGAVSMRAAPVLAYAPVRPALRASCASARSSSAPPARASCASASSSGGEGGQRASVCLC